MKRFVIFLSVLLAFVMQPVSADGLPKGGLQINETFDDGFADGAFEIGNCLRLEFGKEKYTTEIVKGFDGIIVNNNATTNTQFNYKTEGKNASLIVDYDVKFEDIVENGAALDLNLGTSDTNDGTAAITLKFDGKAKTVTCRNKPGGTYYSATDKIGDLQDKEWYHIRHVIIVTDANGNFTPRHSVYINGIECFKTLSFQSTSYYKFPRINKLYTLKYEDKLGTTLYVDNFSSYKLNEEVTDMTEDYGKFLYAVRHAEKMLNSAVVGTNVGEYSQAVYDTFKDEIDSVKSVNYKEMTAAELEQFITSLNAAADDFLPIKEDVTIGASEIKYTYRGVNVPSIEWADTIKITVPVEISRYADGNGENVAVIALLKSTDNEDGTENIINMYTSGNMVFYPDDIENIEFDADISEYENDPDLLSTLSVKILVWDGYSLNKPYVIPAVEF